MAEIPKTISAIVPAYNESARIGAVLSVLTSYPHFSEVIVVDDASTDGTGAVAQQYRVRYIRNEHNSGKGFSMERGVAESSGDILFFCDGDVAGVTHDTLDRILRPVLSGDVDMFVAMRHRPVYHFLKHRVTLVPLVGGERAMQRSLWNRIPSYYKHRFRIEAALNFYAKYYGNGFQMAVFRELSQVIKEKKYGLWRGLQQRIGMLIDVVTAELKLQFVEIPATVHNIRLTLGALAMDLSFLLLGLIVLIGTYFGPRAFILRLFAEELREDPNPILVHALLSLTNVIGVWGLLVIGSGLVLGAMIVLTLHMRKLSHLLRTTHMRLTEMLSKVKIDRK